MRRSKEAVEHFAGQRVDRMDRRRVILVTCVGAACMGVLLALLTPAMEKILLPAAFVYGLFAFPLYALCVAHTNDFADESQYVEVACGLLLVYALGAITGPVVSSLFMQFIGRGGLFAFTALVHLGMIGFVIHRLRRREVTPVEEHISFADALRVSSTISSVDAISHAQEEEESDKQA